ncbi:MAG: zonular occludens toxin domain-containing protein, partial [Arcobacteraceae bacterium]|nr:zonular occludens toxin domain-containing protein [Arcobacteraceae bacterium]
VNNFDYDKFYEKLKIVYEIFDDGKNRDLALDKAKELNIFGISIYFDECHLKLSNQDKIIVWWFSWHRHLNQDIYLITQNKTTIAQKYRVYPEIYIFAEPATKRFNATTMRYVEYANYSMSKNQIIRRFTLKADPEIFKIYKTGEANKGQTYLRKKVYLISAFFLVPFIAFYFFITSFMSDEPEKKDVQQIHQDQQMLNDNNQTLIEPDFIIVNRSGKYVDVLGSLFDMNDPKLRGLFSFKCDVHKVTNDYYRFKFTDPSAIKYANLLINTTRF